MPRFEYSGWLSRKQWEVDLDGRWLTIRAKKGRSEVRRFDSSEEAQREYQRLVAEKLGQGWKQVATAEAGPEPRHAANVALEQAILADPEQVDPYLVYADWLSQEGDPRGELIRLQARGDHEAATRLLAQQARHFYGSLARHIGEAVTVSWHLGFLRSARITVAHDDGAAGDAPDVLDRLLDLASARFIRELTFGLLASPASDGNYQQVILRLVERRPAALRRLFLGDFADPDEWEMSWVGIGDAGALWKAFPRLESLTLQSGTMELGNIDAPELRSFEVRTGGFTRANIRSVCAARWPKLEHLVLWFGMDVYGAEGGVEDIQPILDAAALPNLRHLGLMNAEFTDELCQMLPRSKILAQLRHLDLSMGTMSDEGARAIAAARPAFMHLESLRVGDNHLTAEGLALLAGMPGLVVGQQRDPEERYASVGE